MRFGAFKQMAGGDSAVNLHGDTSHLKQSFTVEKKPEPRALFGPTGNPPVTKSVNTMLENPYNLSSKSIVQTKLMGEYTEDIIASSV